LSVRALLLYFGSIIGVFVGMVHAAPLDGVEMVMGPLPKIDHGAPLDIQIQETARLPHYVLQKLTFVPEPGSVVHAWLLTPIRARNAPAVLCLHQTTEIGKDEPAGLGGNPNLHYAQELALRGYVTLAPDYMHFGEDKTNLRAEIYDRGYQSGSMKGIVNHIRAVDLLVSLPDVDSRRIGVIGHSLGGTNALFLAAFDSRIRAVVISCGFTAKDRYNYLGGGLKNWDQELALPLVGSRYHNSPSEVPFDFSDFFVAIAPRAVFANAPLHDNVFDVAGVDECRDRVAGLFPRGRFVVVHPDCAHGFPPEIREQAYQFLDRELE
jgi:dienelactone hydrolase